MHSWRISRDPRLESVGRSERDRESDAFVSVDQEVDSELDLVDPGRIRII